MHRGPEAARRLLERALPPADHRAPLVLSDGERLILNLLGSVAIDLNLKDYERPSARPEAEQYLGALNGGHSWALRRSGPYLGDHEDDPAVVAEVEDILEMWRHVEWGFEALSDDQKADVVERSDWDREIRFEGFDGNEESAHHSVLVHVVEELGLWSEQKRDDRELDSHWPTLPIYRPMLLAVGRVGKPRGGAKLSADDLTTILAAGAR